MAGGTSSWERFSASVDAPVPYPSTTTALLELGANIMRQAQMVVDGWKLANSTSRIGGADRPVSGARATSPAPSASGSLDVNSRAPRKAGTAGARGAPGAAARDASRKRGKPGGGKSRAAAAAAAAATAAATGSGAGASGDAPRVGI